MPEAASYSGTELEEKIIDHLQQFLLELGRGFTFVVLYEAIIKKVRMYLYGFNR